MKTPQAVALSGTSIVTSPCSKVIFATEDGGLITVSLTDDENGPSLMTLWNREQKRAASMASMAAPAPVKLGHEIAIEFLRKNIEGGASNGLESAQILLDHYRQMEQQQFNRALAGMK